MVNKEQLKPGVWIVQNLIKHQNDYRILRVGRSEKIMTHFNKTVAFGINSFTDKPMKARIGNSLNTPIGYITSKPQYSLLKNANRRYKRQAIQAIFKR